jgi:hypothetical protein
MDDWTFRDYQRASVVGEMPVLVNEILEWTLGLPKKAQAKIDVFVINLQAFEVFPAQYVSAYRGYSGIYELIIKSGGVQYRPLGCYGPGNREFTVLIGAIEKGGKIPKGILNSAVARKESVLHQGWPTCEHEFTRTAA